MKTIAATLLTFFAIAFIGICLWEPITEHPIETFLKYSYFGEITLLLAALIIIFFLYVLFEMVGWDIDKKNNNER